MPKKIVKKTMPPLASQAAVKSSVIAKAATGPKAVAAPATLKSSMSATTAAPKPLPKSPVPSVLVPKAPQPAAPKRASAVFMLEAPHARQVSVCGEFNDWAPDATPLRSQNGGHWSTSVPLPPGRYQYKFVTDGQWIHDPNAKVNVPNEHGSLNSVVEVQA